MVVAPSESRNPAHENKTNGALIIVSANEKFIQKGDSGEMEKEALKKALQGKNTLGGMGRPATGSMSTEEHVSWYRDSEIFDHHLEQWKKNVIASIKPKSGKENADETDRLKKEIVSLKKKLSCKEKALAQTADLLMTEKKARAAWERPECD